MKKSMKRQVAERLIEGIRKGAVTVDKDGTVTVKGKEEKRNLSKYIIQKMVRAGARLNDAGFYEVRGEE